MSEQDTDSKWVLIAMWGGLVLLVLGLSALAQALGP